jgi:hypothetical protein
LVNLEVKFKAANDCHMEITMHPKGGGVIFSQPFEGTWDAEGLAQLSALLKGISAFLTEIPQGD